MNRPLMQHGVGQLEQLFAASKTDPKVLKQLENELRYRQVPRAVALLAEVQGALYTAPPQPKPTAKPNAGFNAGPMTDAPPADGGLRSPPVQPGLWSTPPSAGAATGKAAAAPAPAPSPAPATAPAAPKRESVSPVNSPASRSPSLDAPMVTLADAYKLFKATASSTWESIEQTRRQAVQASSPTRLSGMTESQKSAARQEARRCNAAYAVLLQARSVSHRMA